jgi:hypothetical protein
MTPQKVHFLARDVLIVREAVCAPCPDVETSVTAANSALQRARATMQERLPARRGEWTAIEPTAQERTLLARFIDAHERCDAAAALAISSEDIRIAMPPHPVCFEGRDALSRLLERAFGPERDGDWRLLPARANRMPAAASYLQRPGDSAFRAFKLDVLRIKAGAIAEITTFGPSLFPHFGLPPAL